MVQKNYFSRCVLPRKGVSGLYLKTHRSHLCMNVRKIANTHTATLTNESEHAVTVLHYFDAFFFFSKKILVIKNCLFAKSIPINYKIYLYLHSFSVIAKLKEKL